MSETLPESINKVKTLRSVNEFGDRDRRVINCFGERIEKHKEHRLELKSQPVFFVVINY